MKKILVTGAGGFIGSHLVELLVAKGFDVKAFVHYNSKSDHGWLETSKVKNDIEIYSGDVRDYDSVEKSVEGCDTVFHLAALIGIPYSYTSPMAYIKTNVEGTYNILQSSRKHNISKVMVTSTSETYGTAQYVPIDEKHPLVGQSPYSASKIGADQLAVSYYRSFDTPVKIIRPFNTFGPRQSARAIIPTVISQILSGITDIKLGNLSPTRDLTFVKDTVNGFLEIALADNLFGEVTNIGMNTEISIGELVKKIAKLMDTDISVTTENDRVRPDNSEVERLYCANKKIVDNTSWKPQYNLEEGLKETIEWMKENMKIYKPGIYNI
ncbi:MAG: SDR family NAD(P)-dependent oxidoreductase [Candidatus Delongbacteria bacterium]|nr:SDR family NAD(P)-dependent oxidoreductase [Candidatus Delongbacteria bacterium]